VHRSYVTLVALATVLLVVGALSTTFAGRATGQSTPGEACAPAQDQDLPVGTVVPAECFEDTVQTASSPINNTGCQKNSGNPHIATSMTPDAVKTVGGVISCNSRKDRLHSQSRLWKKISSGNYLLVDTGQSDCTTCYRSVANAHRTCSNNNRNTYAANAYVEVHNNGNRHEGLGESQVVTLNCGF
jgi:hypothetical protein